MRFLVAYNKGTPESKAALELAVKHAKIFNAVLYVVTSQIGGRSEKAKDVAKIQQELGEVKKDLEQTGIEFQICETVRGLSAGEDIVKFAKENNIDQIFVGVEKKSITQKIILGSNAQYIILKAPCPVTSVK